MKKIIALTAALTLAAPTLATAQNQSQVQPLKVTTSTAGPALGLTPGLIAAGIAITVIGIAAISTNGT